MMLGPDLPLANSGLSRGIQRRTPPTEFRISVAQGGTVANTGTIAKMAVRNALRHVWHTVALNERYRKSAGGDDRQAFYDIDKTYPSLRILDRNYDSIREEMEAVLAYKDRLPRYHDLDARETYISGTVDPDKTWKVFMLQCIVGAPKHNQTRCPHTTALIQQIPNVYQAFFSILDPGKSIPAHCGTYYGYLRYHLPLRVPKNNPPSMRVKDRIITWRERESIMFDDSLNHEVYNKSDDLRVVLIVDVLRPMPLHLHAANWFLTRVLFRQSEEGKQALAMFDSYTKGEVVITPST
jgi:aspartyl/asparaginyl beta-hydroxylase (cupin superfamily)